MTPETRAAIYAAFLRSLTGHSDAEAMAEHATEEIAGCLAEVTALRQSGEITEARAALLLDAQADATKAVLLMAEGMEQVSAQNAVNEAIAAVKGIAVAAVKAAL
jgi:hypothetical protein